MPSTGVALVAAWCPRASIHRSAIEYAHSRYIPTDCPYAEGRRHGLSHRRVRRRRPRSRRAAEVHAVAPLLPIRSPADGSSSLTPTRRDLGQAPNRSRRSASLWRDRSSRTFAWCISAYLGAEARVMTWRLLRLRETPRLRHAPGDLFEPRPSAATDSHLDQASTRFGSQGGGKVTVRVEQTTFPTRSGPANARS